MRVVLYIIFLFFVPFVVRTQEISPEIIFVKRIATQDSLNIKTDVELKRHTLFFELGGTAFFYSVNYDLILKQWNNFSINSRIGIMVLPEVSYNRNYSYSIALPMQLSGLYGKKNSKFELGIFLTQWTYIPSKFDKLYFDDKNEYGYHKGINIGYRYQKKQGGLFFRIYFLASYFENGYDKNNFLISYLLPWGGVGLGYTFK